MEQDFDFLWSKCLNVIRDNISEVAFNTWFAPIIPLKYEDNVLTVQVPSQFFYEYLEEKYIDLIQQALYREIGEGTILNYRVLIETENNTAVELRGEAKPIANKPTSAKISVKTPSPFDRVETAEFDSQINPKYSFNNFFEGESNRLARTAAEAVAKNPAKTAFNPLFVHGNSGVGKTHLCHAIGAKVQELYPDKKVLYLSAHLFKVQFTDARRFNTINDFINFYQGIDVLIIDDIQELSGIHRWWGGCDQGDQANACGALPESPARRSWLVGQNGGEPLDRAFQLLVVGCRRAWRAASAAHGSAPGGKATHRPAVQPGGGATVAECLRLDARVE